MGRRKRSSDQKGVPSVGLCENEGWRISSKTDLNCKMQTNEGLRKQKGKIEKFPRFD